MRSLPSLNPVLTRSQAIEHLLLYNPKKDEKQIAAGKRMASGDLSIADFKCIVEWKTRGRGRTRLDANNEDEVVDALRLALSAKTPRASIAVLTGLNGVDVPVASALMAMMQPLDHTIIDFRALSALAYSGHYHSIPFYLHYRSRCIDLAEEWNISLRQLDRALWQWSKDQSGAAKGLRKPDA